MLCALIALLFILNPKEAHGATTKADELTPKQKLEADPSLEYKGVKQFNQIPGWGCVGALRNKGYYVPKTRTGGAGSIVVDSTALPPEGEYVVIVTSESRAGHVALAANVAGQLIVREEGGFGKRGGKGRVVSPAVYKGYVASPQPDKKGGDPI